MSSPLLAGFQTGFNAVSAWRERKENQAKIDKQVEAMKLATFQLGQGFDQDRADGVITDQEYNNRMSWGISISNEMMTNVKTLYDNARKMSKEELDMELGNLDSLYNIYKEADYKDPTELRALIGNFKSPKAKMQGEYYLSILEKQQETKLERFSTLKEFYAAHGEGAPYEYDDDGYLRPKYVGDSKMNEYQMKRKNVQDNPNLTEAEKARGIYKIDTGIDLGDGNDDNDDFTSPEGKRTLDLAFTTSFGYTTPDGTKIAGIIPSRLARQLSMGRKATDEEKEGVMYDWSLRKATTRKLGGKMAVQAVEDVLNQLFRETKPEEVVKDSVLDKAIKEINKLFGTEEPEEGKETKKVPPPAVSSDSKMALIPTLTDDELKKQANAAAQEDVNSELYRVLYEECKKRGLLQ